ncbi:hypothetical protein [Spirochaeta dissipatitropha]
MKYVIRGIGILLCMLVVVQFATAERNYPAELADELLRSGWQNSTEAELRHALDTLDWEATTFASAEASALGLMYIVENSSEVSLQNAAEMALELSRISSTMRRAGASSRDSALATVMGARKISHVLDSLSREPDHAFPDLVRGELGSFIAAQSRVISGREVQSRVRQILSDVPIPGTLPGPGTGMPNDLNVPAGP